MVPREHKIHLHCFTESFTVAQMWFSVFPNLKIGLTPLVTFPSAKNTHNVARRVPLDKLLLETDSPYFIPRGVCLLVHFLLVSLFVTVTEYH